MSFADVVIAVVAVLLSAIAFLSAGRAGMAARHFEQEWVQESARLSHRVMMLEQALQAAGIPLPTDES